MKKVPTPIVVPNIYANPDAVRKEALESPYCQPNKLVPYFVSTINSKFASQVSKKIEEIMGEAIYDAHASRPFCSVGRFVYGQEVASNSIVVHTDPYMWSGIVYLSPRPAPHSGTSFYRHKATGKTGRDLPLDRSDLQGMGALNVDSHVENYDVICTIPNVYNSLALFEATYFHSPEGYFGRDIHSARLIQQFFFNLGRSYRDEEARPLRV
jgi:hypothetical protein